MGKAFGLKLPPAVFEICLVCKPVKMGIEYEQK